MLKKKGNEKMREISKKLFIILQLCIPQHGLSRITSLLAKSEIFWVKNILIKTFLYFFKVNLSESEHNKLDEFRSFNDFFTRKLKEEAREIDDRLNKLISPVDGSISELGSIENDKLIQAKGKYYSLSSLLAADSSLTNIFREGDFMTIYLAPKDYHRVHMPCDGRLLKTIYIPGKLFSVNQITVESVNNLFAKNERLVCLFDTKNGPMLLILVGAMIVCGINTIWKMPKPEGKIQTLEHDIYLSKGQEMGSFSLGSTVILLFPQRSINWENELVSGSDIKLGSPIANLKEEEAYPIP